jgi:hypothetical protein
MLSIQNCANIKLKSTIRGSALLLPVWRLLDGQSPDWPCPNLRLTESLTVAPCTLFLNNVEITYFMHRESQDQALSPFRLVLKGEPVNSQTSYDFDWVWHWWIILKELLYVEQGCNTAFQEAWMWGPWWLG